MNQNLLNKRRIAILEDDPTNRERLSDLISLCGGEPVPASPKAPKLIDFDNFLKKNHSSLIVCDHRLFEHGNYASYTGAEAIAKSYLNGLGGVLVTAWEKDDSESSIRKFRRWIPALIHSSDLNRIVLEEALLKADQEVREKNPPPERLPHRTIMTIESINNIGRVQIVKVIMSQWNIQQEVGFPLSIIPNQIKSEVSPGKMLIAQVNIGALNAEDLFFTEFESIDPYVFEKSQTLF
jgi:hypothetical protein